MIVECSKCKTRHEISKTKRDIEIICKCGEKLVVFPWIKHKQFQRGFDSIKCSACGTTFNKELFRNNTEVVCDCGNVLIFEITEVSKKNVGRRKSDFTNQLLELQLHGLVDTCRLFHIVNDTNKLLQLIIRVATELVDAEGVSIILRDVKTKKLVFHSVIGEKASELSSFTLDEGEGIVGECIRNVQTIIVNSVNKDSRFSPSADKKSGFLTRNLLCLPLTVDNECIGAIEAVNKKNNKEFNENDILLAEAISSQVSIAIRNAKLTEAAIKSERLAAIGQTIVGTAHCINNMLNGLHGGLYILKSDIEQNYGNVPEIGFNMLEKNINLFQSLVKDMLSYSKDRAPEYKTSSLHEIIKSVLELIKLKAKENKVKISHDLSLNLDKIEMDSKEIYRCILNLVTNAIDACNKKNSVIVVKTKSISDGFVLIEITDNGIGMDEETKSSIFKPFFSSKGSKGTGLGLSVTQKIINEHGGSLEVFSTKDKGSCFKIHLPRKHHSVQVVNIDLNNNL